MLFFIIWAIIFFVYCSEGKSDNSWQRRLCNLRYYRLYLCSSFSLFVQSICNGFICCRDWSYHLYLS